MQLLSAQKFVALPKPILLGDGNILIALFHGFGWITSIMLNWFIIMCAFRSFYQPWKDHSSKLTDSEKIEEIHACQMLLLIVSKMLARNSLYSKLISLKDVEKLGVFEWERSILNVNHV